MRHEGNQKAANVYLIVICVLIGLSCACMVEIPWFKAVPAFIMLIATGMLMCGLAEVAEKDENEEENEDEEEDYYA